MRIRVVHRYFWPDSPPYARFLRAIAGRWAAGGHTVDVLTSQPGYNSSSRGRRPRIERVGDLAVRRVATVPESGSTTRQLANLVVFPAAVGLRLLRGPSADVLMCSTAPQVSLGAAVSLVARLRGAAFVYHCMDLHPEIGVLSGEFAHPLVRRVLARIDLATMRRATRVVVLSEDMRQAVLARDPDLADRVVVLNNFSLPDDGDPATSPLDPPAPGVLRVVFTGNLGRFQGLPELVAALDLVDPSTSVELVFMGAGKALPDVEAAAAARNPTSPHAVRILPHGSVAQAKALMGSAHLGVISLVPGVVRYAYPSKTATYAEAGLPLLVVCEPEAELARTVTSEGLGWCAAPGDANAVAASIEEVARELAEGRWADRADRVRAYAAAEFEEQKVLAKWESLIGEIQRERSEGGA